MAAGVFISYRREDAAADAGRLLDDLRRRCARGRVFMDLEIPPGADFRQVLEEKLDGCQVLLALIGPDWSEARDADGNRRIEQADDYVRLEIATALSRGKRVIPVLLRGVDMVSPANLPADLRELAMRQAHRLDYARWAGDVNAMVEHFPASLGCRKALGRSAGWSGLLPAAAVAIAFLVALYAAVFPLDVSFVQVSAAGAVVVGGVHAWRYRLSSGHRLALSLAIALPCSVLAWVLGSLMSGVALSDYSAGDVRMAVGYLAGLVLGYLAGTLIVDLIAARAAGSGEAPLA